MYKEHKKIEALILKKIKEINKNRTHSSKNEEAKIIKTLNILVSDKSKKFFSSIDIDRAKAILMYLGINEEEWFETYIELMEEDERAKPEYTLLEIDSEEFTAQNTEER